MGVADALSHRQNGAGPAACAAPREQDKQWPGWSMREALRPEAEPWEYWRQKVLTWREEGTHNIRRNYSGGVCAMEP
jgi:hypothetical protein